MNNFGMAMSSTSTSISLPPPLAPLALPPLDEARMGPVVVDQVVAEGEMDAFADERSWFSTRVEEVLMKLRKVLLVTGGSTLDDQGVFLVVASARSLQEMLQRLREATVEEQLFRGLLTDEEWREIVESDEALASQDVSRLRKARLRRQWRLLSGMQRAAVDLTVQDSVEVEEETRLVSECMKMMQDVLTKVGMNPRGTMRRKPKAAKQVEEETRQNDVVEEVQQRPQRRREREKTPMASAVTPTPPKRVQKKQKTRVAENEQSREEEVQNEAVPDAAPVEVNNQLLDLLAEASMSVNVVVDLLRGYYESEKQLTIRIGDIEPPSCSLADPSLLTLNEELASSCLDEQHEEKTEQLEQWGQLLKVWRLCRRALVIVAVFQRLNQTKNRGRTRIQDRFDDALKRLKCSKVIHYHHALVYEKIGLFLLRYPRFMFQLRLVHLDEWSAVMDQLEKASLVDWTTPPEYNNGAIIIGSTDNNNAGPCYVCSHGRERGSSVWQCSDCSRDFHESCAGYPEKSLHGEIQLKEGVTLKVSLYCAQCLENLEFQHTYVTRKVAEMIAIARFFNDPSCCFQLEPVPGDGYCLFGILEGFARQYLGFTGSSDQFCRALAKAALDSFESTMAEIMGQNVVMIDVNNNVELSRAHDFIDEAEQASVDAFKSLCRGSVRGAKSRVKGGLWEKIEAQHVLRGYAEFMFPAQVVVRSYQASDKGTFGESGQYGSPPGGGGRELFLLHWNTGKHYDLMLRRG